MDLSQSNCFRLEDMIGEGVNVALAPRIFHLREEQKKVCCDILFTFSVAPSNARNLSSPSSWALFTSNAMTMEEEDDLFRCAICGTAEGDSSNLTTQSSLQTNATVGCGHQL